MERSWRKTLRDTIENVIDAQIHVGDSRETTSPSFLSFASQFDSGMLSGSAGRGNHSDHENTFEFSHKWAVSSAGRAVDS